MSRPWIGPRTRVVELRGRTVTPGFGDAHVHPVSAGLEPDALRPRRRPGSDAYLAVIAAYAAAHPDEPWIRGDGWSMADFPGGLPHRDDLDRVVPDRPVYLESADGHRPAWRAPLGRRHRHDARDHLYRADTLQPVAGVCVSSRSVGTEARVLHGAGRRAADCVYDYWGYYNVCYLGGEITDPGRVIPRAILLSIGGVAILYLTMNISILGAMPWQEVEKSRFIASDFMARIWGPRSARSSR